MLAIVEAHYLEDYKIHLRYEDGASGIIDFSDQKRVNMFADWEDINVFRAFRVNPESGTLEWPNGMDIAPEFLYARVTGIPQGEAFSAMLSHAEKIARKQSENRP